MIRFIPLCDTEKYGKALYQVGGQIVRMSACRLSRDSTEKGQFSQVSVQRILLAVTKPFLVLRSSVLEFCRSISYSICGKVHT